jgi:hypothetical protein
VNVIKAVCGAVASIMISTAAFAAEPVITLAPAAAAPVADRMQETVCRKDKETGSLVKTKKTCHTRAQWQYIDQTNQNFSRDLVDSTRTKSGSN